MRIIFFIFIYIFIFGFAKAQNETTNYDSVNYFDNPIVFKANKVEEEEYEIPTKIDTKNKVIISNEKKFEDVELRNNFYSNQRNNEKLIYSKRKLKFGITFSILRNFNSISVSTLKIPSGVDVSYGTSYNVQVGGFIPLNKDIYLGGLLGLGGFSNYIRYNNNYDFLYLFSSRDENSLFYGSIGLNIGTYSKKFNPNFSFVYDINSNYNLSLEDKNKNIISNNIRLNQFNLNFGVDYKVRKFLLGFSFGGVISDQINNIKLPSNYEKYDDDDDDITSSKLNYKVSAIDFSFNFGLHFKVLIK